MSQYLKVQYLGILFKHIRKLTTFICRNDKKKNGLVAQQYITVL